MPTGQTFQQSTQVQTLRLCPSQGWPRYRPDKLANTQQHPAFVELSMCKWLFGNLNTGDEESELLEFPIESKNVGVSQCSKAGYQRYVVRKSDFLGKFQN